jgi:GT2 family glycosyltransferase
MTVRQVTTVVMTRDRWPELRATLGRHRGPVIVVDNGSRDGTPDLVRRHFPDVELVALPGNLGAVARNVGVHLARTPYVAFADDDSWWEPGSLERAAEYLDACPRLAVVAGRTEVGPSRRPDPVSELMRRSPLGRPPGLPGPLVLGFLACSAVVRKKAFEAVGGFDDLLHFMGEEELLALDLAAHGWSSVYAHSVVAHHEPSPTRDSTERRVRAGRNRLLTAMMRRPWPVVARYCAQEWRSGAAGRAAVRQSLRLAPGALHRRRLLPARVEAMRALLEGCPAGGPAGQSAGRSTGEESPDPA